MLERKGNIWDCYEDNPEGVIVITTNGMVRKDGNAVMGRGIAKQTADRFPRFPKLFGKRLLTQGNTLFWFPDYRIITFPVKHNWYDSQADMALIQTSVYQLHSFWLSRISHRIVYLPRPGCGCGGLLWKDVRPLLQDVLVEDYFEVVDFAKDTK